eukprot:CAMPEP_0182436020 /NCGR_PEP_ID=MMETSP1167-20130531/79089_1 /TAXON_ID=2988 /ORGANISM="Mallomonas Sp, Strain CCMP3275" /LENGTH=202 /DNA_ID=CAMNT_0024627705 /DNA_START=107 /DNA_END=712 /DNA_ORIENTATION=-
MCKKLDSEMEPSVRAHSPDGFNPQSSENKEYKELLSLKILQKRHSQLKRRSNHGVKLESLNTNDVDNTETENTDIENYPDSYNDKVGDQSDLTDEDDNKEDTPVIQKGWLGKLGRGRARAPLRLQHHSKASSSRSDGHPGEQVSLSPLPPVITHSQPQPHEVRGYKSHNSHLPPRRRKHAPIHHEQSEGDRPPGGGRGRGRG